MQLKGLGDRLISPSRSGQVLVYTGQKCGNHDFPRPRPDSTTFQGWKIWILKSRISPTFQDLYAPWEQHGAFPLTWHHWSIISRSREQKRCVWCCGRRTSSRWCCIWKLKSICNHTWSWCIISQSCQWKSCVWRGSCRPCSWHCIWRLKIREVHKAESFYSASA